jgi:hypothetical protein
MKYPNYPFNLESRFHRVLEIEISELDVTFESYKFWGKNKFYISILHSCWKKETKNKFKNINFGKFLLINIWEFSTSKVSNLVLFISEILKILFLCLKTPISLIKRERF